MDQASLFGQERLRSLAEFVRQQVESRIALIRFALVGGSGYLVYQGILFLVYDSPAFWFLPSKSTSAFIIFFEHTDVRLLIATLIATAVTVVAVFIGHNAWTFSDRSPMRKPLWMRFVQFVAAASIGVAIVAVTVNVLAVEFDMYHFVALPIGVALAGIWDWLWYSQFVWRRAHRRDAPS